MSKTYACVGHEGHECGKKVFRLRALKKDEEARCEPCKHEHKRLYQAHYRELYDGAKLEELREYQRKYNHRTRKARAQRLRYEKYTRSTVAKKQDREQIKSTYNHSELMHSPTESFEKAINRILSGQADMAAVK